MRPQKDDVARWITIGKRQPYNLCVEVFRDLGVRDRKVGFVDMHHARWPEHFGAQRCHVQHIDTFTSESATRRVHRDR